MSDVLLQCHVFLMHSVHDVFAPSQPSGWLIHFSLCLPLICAGAQGALPSLVPPPPQKASDRYRRAGLRASCRAEICK